MTAKCSEPPPPRHLTPQFRAGRAILALAALATSGLVGPSQAAQAQAAPATVTGALLNKETRAPVEGARVAILGTGLAVETDSSGRFHLAGIAPGVRVIQMRAIGYSVASWLLQLDEGQSFRSEFEMEPRIYALSEVTVAGDDSERWHSEAGFEFRRARLPGHFFSRQDIAARRPNSLADLLRSVPGVMTTCRGRNCQVVMGRGQCVPEYFLDGYPASISTGPGFPINQIRGVEIYRSATEAPAEFQRIGLRCGVVAIWTVEPGESLTRPGSRIGARDSVDAPRPERNQPRPERPQLPDP